MHVRHCMLFGELARVSQAVAATSARTKKIELLSAFLGRLLPEELRVAVFYLSGDLPQGKIGIGYATVRDAAAQSAASEPSLQVLDVDAALTQLQSVRGAGSTAERARLLGALLARATREEQDFLLRLLVGELRQGALEGVMTESVARATGLPVGSIRRAAMLSGCLPEIAQVAMAEGEAGLARFRIEVFRPVSPMLADAAEDGAASVSHLNEARAEFKLDGARVQVHRRGDDVRVYSRSLLDVTEAAAELVTLARSLPGREFVLDGEAIALKPDGSPEPFQITMRRFGRKSKQSAAQADLPLQALFFDCLQVDGRDLIDLPLRERAQVLHTLLPESARIPSRLVSSAEDVDEFLKTALENGHEGLMLKSLDGVYEAGRRGSNWLKLKPAYTLDLVVLAAEWGSGRRKGWLSNLHLGARDPVTGGFVMLGKTFKGMTDEMLRWQTETFPTLEVARDPYTVYLRPELVVEVAIDGVQASSQYPGGVALRFARVKRYRPDKSAADADTIDSVRALDRGALMR